MKFATSALLTTILASSAIAAPAPSTDADAITTFSLKTRSSNKAFDGLCVEAYHTGAGTADAVLGKCTKASKEFYLNKTAIATTAYGSDIQSGIQLVDAPVTYDQWAPVTVNGIAPPTKGFTYSSTKGFLQPKTFGGYGFIACDWAHSGAPQLFGLGQSNKDTTVISTCALVDLVQG